MGVLYGDDDAAVCFSVVIVLVEYKRRRRRGYCNYSQFFFSLSEQHISSFFFSTNIMTKIHVVYCGA